MIAAFLLAEPHQLAWFALGLLALGAVNAGLTIAWHRRERRNELAVLRVVAVHGPLHEGEVFACVYSQRISRTALYRHLFALRERGLIRVVTWDDHERRVYALTALGEYELAKESGR